MKDKDQLLIFENYQKKRLRDAKVAYICEDFGDPTKNPFGNDSDDSDDSNDSNDSNDSDNDSNDSNDDSTEKSNDSESKDSSSSKSSSKPKSSKPKDKPKDGKLSEEELDEELDALATKKDKIQKLFDSESIDKDVAHAALDKLKSLTNALVAQYI